MSSPENASAFQQRLTTISNLHNQATSDLAARDKELRSVQDRLSTLAQNSTSATVTLTKRAEEAERELRWAKEGRQSAERREMLAKKEAELMTISAVCYHGVASEMTDRVIGAEHARRGRAIQRRSSS